MTEISAGAVEELRAERVSGEPGADRSDDDRAARAADAARAVAFVLRIECVP